MSEGKKVNCFFLCLNRYAAVDVSREVGAAYKTAYENDRATKRGRYSEVPSLSLSYNLAALGALRDIFRPIRYLFCVSSLCSASD